MKVGIMKLNDTAIIPTMASCDAAGADLYANIPNESVTIDPGDTRFIPTGLVMMIPKQYGGFIYARSGLACKQGLRPANCVGVIDSDYRGEIIVAIHNDSAIPRVISHGNRIAQIVISPCAQPEFEEMNIQNDTERGKGGFGHTGT